MGQLITNFDTTKLFLGNNFFENGSYKNTTAGEVTLVAGTLLGKRNAVVVDSTNVVGNLVPHLAADTEGGAIAVGILAQDLVVAAGATVTGVRYCIKGEFDLSKLVLGGANTLATLISGKTIKEQIIAETQLIGVTVSQLTALDNQ